MISFFFVRRIVGRVVIIIIIVIILGIRDYHNLTQDLVQLVATGFLISSPLNEDVETQRFYSSSCVLPSCFPQQCIIPRMSVPYVGKDCQLDSAREWNVF